MTDGQAQGFRPRARLLQLLGDQLIGSPRLAIFELVKNAYDADANSAVVTMTNLTRQDATISVRDDGFGMSESVLRDIWLVPGHDHKMRAKAAGKRSPRGRLPLGDKGVGRFAVHKLGSVVEVVTRTADELECIMRIDWDEIADSEFLDEARVTVETREPMEFLGDATGTLVTVTALRGAAWTRGEARRLFRQITSISSPFVDREGDFKAVLRLPNESKWLDDIPDTQALLDSAPWSFRFELIGNRFRWWYDFRGVPGVAVPARSATGDETGILLDLGDLPEAEREALKREELSVRAVRSAAEYQQGIGDVHANVVVFDRDKDVLAKIGQSASLQEFLNETGGLRVYRDGIRVYNYGEPGDDWLGLDIRRVNSPSKRVSNNILVGAVDLDLSTSTGLAEKTNREGFVEGRELQLLRALLRGALAVFEAERNKDKSAMRRLMRKERDGLKGGIEQPLQQIKKLAAKNDLALQIDPLIDRAQRAYNDMRDIMLRAGVSSMSLVIVYHEIDHGVRLLHSALRQGADVDKVLLQAKDLVGVLDSFGDLLRKSQSATHDVRKLAQRAVELNSVRLRNHGIAVEIRLEPEPAVESSLADFPFGLVLGAVTNLIDNSVYWLSSQWQSHDSVGDQKLLVAVDTESFDGPALIVADNGPGLADDVADLVEPFFTRRPDGIGVGLYYVNLIMQSIGGSLVQVDRDVLTVDPRYGGAALALVFGRK